MTNSIVSFTQTEKGDFPYILDASDSPSGNIGNKMIKVQNSRDLTFGYAQQHNTHQPRTMFDPQVGTLEFFWDANGNLAQIIGCKQNSCRLHEWDEENRLRFVLGEKYAGYYGYDANGERVYKLTGTSNLRQVNSGSMKAQAIFDDAVLYPNPYVVVTPKGYTKHYYAGTERLATVIGGGGFDDMTQSIVKLSSQHDWDIVDAFYEQYLNYDPFRQERLLSTAIPTEDIAGVQYPELAYNCQPMLLEHIYILPKQDILQSAIAQNSTVNRQEDEIYFYHGDHLGSAHWITDGGGMPIQYIHYAPYGELITNQAPYGYDERYKFTGKERDSETGYDYYPARFLWSDAGIWLSVDPLADKYPWISPYAYCAWSPIKNVDPDGRDIYIFDSDGIFTGQIIKQDGDHIGRIYQSEDNYVDFSFNDQSYADRICEPYSDKWFSLVSKNNPDFSPITHVSLVNKEQINNILPLKDIKTLKILDLVGGAYGGLIGALVYASGGIGSLSYALCESRGGKLDFVNSGLIQKDASAIFLPIDGKNVSYDSFDFGNYIWGQSMQRLGIGLGLSIIGAHADCWIHNGQLDSKADQRAINNGYMFKIKR